MACKDGRKRAEKFSSFKAHRKGWKNNPFLGRNKIRRNGCFFFFGKALRMCLSDAQAKKKVNIK